MRLLFISTAPNPHIILLSNLLYHKTWCGKLFKKEKNLTVEFDQDIPGICKICLRGAFSGALKYVDNYPLTQRLQDRMEFTRPCYREEDTAPDILGASTEAMQKKAAAIIKHEPRDK